MLGAGGQRVLAHARRSGAAAQCSGGRAGRGQRPFTLDPVSKRCCAQVAGACSRTVAAAAQRRSALAGALGEVSNPKSLTLYQNDAVRRWPARARAWSPLRRGSTARWRARWARSAARPPSPMQSVLHWEPRSRASTASRCAEALYAFCKRARGCQTWKAFRVGPSAAAVPC